MQQYQQLLADILAKGTSKPAARENMPGTTSLFGYQFRHDMSTGFPLITTKKMYWKGVVVELLWFLRGDTNVKYLIDNGVNIWNEDAYNYYLKLCKEQGIERTISYELFCSYIKQAKSIDELTFDSMSNAEVSHPLTPSGYVLGDCGFQYGRVWRNWDGNDQVIMDVNMIPKDLNTDQVLEELRKMAKDVGLFPVNSTPSIETRGVDQITKLIHGLLKNPSSRRHIVTAVDPSNENNLALYWCHSMFQFNCRPMSHDDRLKYLDQRSYANMPETYNEKDREERMDKLGVPKYYLDCQLYQRSADVFLGVPFNIASYALLLEIVALVCRMVPGEYIHTFGDVHIYDNHRDQVLEQIGREPKKLPEFDMNGSLIMQWQELKDIKIDDSMSYKDFEIINYESHPPIKAELSTGMKK